MKARFHQAAMLDSVLQARALQAWRLSTLCFFLVVGLLLSAAAAAEISLEQLKQRESDFNWKALEKGEVVARDLPDDEVDDAALVVLVGVKLRAGLDEVLERLERGEPGTEDIRLDAQSDESVRESLNAYKIHPGQRIGVEWFYSPVADGTLNMNKEELRALQTVALDARDSGKDQQQILADMEVAIRDLLAARVNEYLHGGLAAVSPYDLDGKQIHPGDYLADSMQPLALLREEDPDFYKAFAEFPNEHGKDYGDRFFVSIEENPELGGSVTSLKHWMIEQSPDYALIAERKFYISYSLDAMNTLILLFPDGEECYVFLLNLTFTQKVTGIGGFIAHKVGRSKVKYNVVPLLEGLQAAFP